VAISAEDVAEVVAFAVTRPRRMTLNEILIRPTAQELWPLPRTSAVLAIILASYTMIGAGHLDRHHRAAEDPPQRSASRPPRCPGYRTPTCWPFGGLLLLGARAGDLVGRRRMFIIGLGLFTLASVAVGTAQSEVPASAAPAQPASSALAPDGSSRIEPASDDRPQPRPRQRLSRPVSAGRSVPARGGHPLARL
jgi:hypothetical protein